LPKTGAPLFSFQPCHGRLASAPDVDRPPRANRTQAPSSLQNIRLSSDAVNSLTRSQNWRADGDGCDGLHLMQVSRRTQACNGLTVQGEHWQGSLSDRRLIAENCCAALFVSTVSSARSLCAGCRPPPLHGQGPPSRVFAWLLPIQTDSGMAERPGHPSQLRFG
jgi:hypothetical protein